MASNKKKTKAKPAKVKRLPTIFITFITITVIVIGFLHYKLNTTKPNEDQQAAAIEALSNDLQLAAKPLDAETFPLEQIFGYSPIWGSLNSGHYFGLKLSSPESIETSFVWFKNEVNQAGGLNLRHLCNQNDRLSFYSWTRHDFWSFGQQEIEDDDLDIKTSYLKNPQNHLEWAAKIDIDFSLNDATNRPISIIQYVTTNHRDDWIEVAKTPAGDDASETKALKLRGYSRDIGKFEMSIMRVNKSNKNEPILSSYHVGFIDKEKYTIDSYLQRVMTPTQIGGTRLFLVANKPKRSNREDSMHNVPNIIAYQLVLYGPSSIMISFKQVDSFESNFDDFVDQLDVNLRNKIQDFDNRFASKFPMKSTAQDQDFTQISADRLARVALANMIGSIGYFYGLSFIGTNANLNKIVPYGPIQLLTAVPSRSFFPRGFLWDEGFHNLLISRWDPEISNKIIKSWFDIMNINGWVPREIILGLESMRRVPPEFIVQRITTANPPAMFIVLEQMLDDGTLTEQTFEHIYPKLKVWYNWFKLTQYGEKSSTFRWRGRDELSVDMLNPKTLSSGLDDYPRSSHPSPDEYHIDLRCWMALAARTLSKFAKKSGDYEFYERISKDADTLTDNKLLDELHWSDEHQMYCDFGHNTKMAELLLVTKTRVSPSKRERIETYQTYERHSTGHPNFGCVPEFGYVSLFPLILGILDPKNDKLGVILSKLRDENELWSPFGIRSLSKSSKYYNKYNTQHDKPYWRGAIWLNINYLILSALKSYSNQDGPYKERCSNLFAELKSNLVSNIMREFSRTNYMWENYNDQNGQGQGSHPFTGWTSLILLVMSSNLG